MMDLCYCFHGLCAYRGTTNAITLRANAEKAITDNVDIAVSDRAIGVVGLALDCEIRELYSRDCWSEISNNGIRRVNSDRFDAISFDDHRTTIDQLFDDLAFSHMIAKIENPNNTEFQQFCATAKARKSVRYCEAFSNKNKHIRYVWVKERASDAVYNAAMLYAKTKKVPFLVIANDRHTFDELQFLKEDLI